MKIVDSGVLPPSFMDFTIPSHFATDALYYVPQFGHFYCDQNYHISREHLDLYLLVYVRSGSLFIETRDRQFIAFANQVALLDCNVPHTYYCTEPTEFLWFHFNGCNSKQYSDYLYDQGGVVFVGENVPGLQRHFERIFDYSQEVPSNEHMVGVHVGEILGRLAAPAKRASANRLLDPAIYYIREHYHEAITLEELANLCSMSKSHFIRSFGKYANRTPHEYLLAYRLRQAKQLLLTTDLSIEQIAEECGFNSASHFARAFRKSNGISPTEFKTIPF